MDEVIAYMKHRGWSDQGGVVIDPKGQPFETWEDAIKQLVFDATCTPD